MSSSNTLKWLDDIQKYYDAHVQDFKQVLFSPASVTATRTDQKIIPSVIPMKSVPGFHTLETCTLNAAQEGGEYFALEPNSGKCDIYSASQIDPSYNMPGTVEDVWKMPIPETTEYICLDMVGNLNAYSINHDLLKTLISSGARVAGRYHLVLLDSPTNRLQPLRIRDTRNDAALTVITLPSSRETAFPLELVVNPVWEQDTNALKRSMSNADAQIKDKRIAVDKITATKSLVSTNYKYRLCIINGNLVLQAMIKDTRQIYKTNVDNKVGKLYYASSYKEHQFLKEVPASMQTLGSSYTRYTEIYPDPSGNYTVVPGDNCAEECNKSADCKSVYAVTDSENQKSCYMMPTTPATFNPRPTTSTLNKSVLKIKNPIILTNKDNMEYSKASYIANGYKSQFSSYTPGEPLNASFIPGPKGAPYVQDLYKQIRESTFGPSTNTMEQSSPAASPPMEQSSPEPFKEGFTLDNVLNRLNAAKAEADKYYAKQTDISNNVAAINAKAASINAKYANMENNNAKYDFTGKEVKKLGADKYSINTALENDNEIYTFQQNKMYAIMGLTMATLLVTAIIIK